MEFANNAEILFEIPNCILYDVVGEKATCMFTAPLAVYELKQQNIFFIKMLNWEYCFQKEIPVLKQPINSQQMYIFPNMLGNYGLLFHTTTSEDLISVFENFLESNTDFVVATPDKQEVDGDDSSSSSSDDEVTKKTKPTRGEKIRDGLINLGQRIAQRVEKRKVRIIQRISKPRFIKIRPETLERIRKLRIFSDRIFKVSKDAINGMLDVAKKIMSNLANKIGETKIGKKIRNNKVYCDFKASLKNGIKSIAAVYDGMITAKHIIEAALQQAAVDIVTAKYGDSAGQLTNEILSIGQNYRQFHHIGQYVKQDQAQQITGVTSHSHDNSSSHGSNSNSHHPQSHSQTPSQQYKQQQQTPSQLPNQQQPGQFNQNYPQNQGNYPQNQGNYPQNQGNQRNNPGNYPTNNYGDNTQMNNQNNNYNYNNQQPYIQKDQQNAKYPQLNQPNQYPPLAPPPAGMNNYQQGQYYGGNQQQYY